MRPELWVIAALLLMGAAIAVWANVGRAPDRDPVRLFTPAQKRRAAARCGGRCEHSRWLFRCRAAGTAGDHIYPWSKGGRTIESNLQMLCPRHNGRKSAMIPSWWYIKRLEMRRRRYFPPDADRRVRWR